MTTLRYQIHDREIGHLRSFASKDIAKKYLTKDTKLVILPRPKKPKFNFADYEEAPF